MAKTQYHHGQLREALLDAGDRLLAEKGMRGFTLRSCARIAAVSHAAPKHHFGDVRGFLTAIAARGFARLTDALREEISQSGNLEAEFVATSRTYLDFAEQYPEHFRIMFRCDLLDMEDEVLYYNVGATLTELTNVILRQRGEPEITIDGLNDRICALDSLIDDIVIGWSHIHGLAHLRIEQQLTMIPEERMQSITSQAGLRLSRLLQG